MVRRKTLCVWIVLIFLLFLLTTHYLLIVLQRKNEPAFMSVHDLIYLEYKKLPTNYGVTSSIRNIYLDFLKHIQNRSMPNNYEMMWKEANEWVSEQQLVNVMSPYLGQLLFALKKAKIIKADLDTRGTQLKLLLTLSGGQDVVFKPKWYDKNEVINGPVYAGKDRYASEILAFHLSVILNKPLVPVSVERQVSFKHEILPVSTKRLIDTSYENKNNQTCIYGNCLYCKKEEPICENEDFIVSGAVIFNINKPLKSHRSPWQRTYKKGKKAVWEESDLYCDIIKNKIPKQRLLDLIDAAIFDFLIQNGDRHHYETLNERIVLLDNGKGLGNPFVHHMDILAPLYQCCLIRQQTWRQVLNLAGGKLQEYLQIIPDIESLVKEDHLKAIDERLRFIYSAIEYCKHINPDVI